MMQTRASDPDLGMPRRHEEASVHARRRPPRARDPLVSLVVPVHNESATVQEFVDSVEPVIAAAQVRVEIVFVNDGSSDGTLDALFRLQEADERVRVVNLSRNFGKEAALTAGLDESRGDVVVPIDVDLQDPPELLLPFLERWRDGYDVVYGIRRSRTGDPLLVRFTARWFYRTFNLVSQTPIPEDVGDFRLMDRRVVDAILQMGERSRFMKGLFSWVGYPSVGVEFERPERSGGATSWTAWRRWNFALDGIASFSAAPLRIWTYIGLAIAVGCGIYGLVILTLALLGEVDQPGYASLILVVLFLGAMQLVSLGLIGEYLGRVPTESKRRPLYLLEGVYEAPPATEPSATEPPATEQLEPPPAAAAPASVELAGTVLEGDRRGP